MATLHKFEPAGYAFPEGSFPYSTGVAARAEFGTDARGTAEERLVDVR